MENKINIAEILKDCPKGMELDCAIYNNVEFEGISDNKDWPIKISVEGYPEVLNPYGCISYRDYTKCVIFPKGKTSWGGFVPPREFKRGDILHIDCSEEFDKDQHEYEYIFILDRIQNGQVHSYCHYYMMHDSFYPKTAYLADDKYPIRFATEEEKQKLFNAIKASDWYKWNGETKTLEKLVKPKFKVGDRIKKKGEHSTFTITDVNEAHYFCGKYVICDTCDNNWELAPDKFDINTLIPFESRVLVRDRSYEMWRASFWGCLVNSEYGLIYDTTRGCYKQCIPYEGNEHLLGNSDDCDNFYKIWGNI